MSSIKCNIGLLLLYFVFVEVFVQARCKFCLTCDNVPDDDDCHTAQECQPHDLCFHDITVNATGHTHHSLGCRSEAFCNAAVVGKRAGQIVICSTCCHNELCTTLGCQHTDHCLSNPCVHGTCHTYDTDYTCTCDHGYVGKNCNLRSQVDHCSPNPCIHGTCNSSGDHHVCTCKTGYTGINCDSAVIPCHSNPCVFGDCRNNGDQYTCICVRGYTGTNCDVAHPDACSSAPCVHGTCINHGSSYTCMCNAGYTGARCDKVSGSHCSPNPCLHGTCTTSGDHYVCTCNAGYTGTNCDKGATGPTGSTNTTIPACVDKTPPETCRVAAAVICTDRNKAQNANCLHFCGFC